jgi:hypothetical protein
VKRVRVREEMRREKMGEREKRSQEKETTTRRR